MTAQPQRLSWRLSMQCLTPLFFCQRRAVICTMPPANNDRTEPKRYFGIHYGIREEERSIVRLCVSGEHLQKNREQGRTVLNEQKKMTFPAENAEMQTESLSGVESKNVERS